MRSFRRASACVLALVLTAPSCDTTQPLQVSEQVASILLTTNALVQIYDVFDETVDTNGDGTPDALTGRAVCREVKDAQGNLEQADRRVPWKVAVDIKVQHAGSTTPETVASSFNEFDPFTSVLEYDTVAMAVPNPPPAPPFYYTNGERISGANRRYLERCGGQTPLPDPNILGGPLPRDVPLLKGDTIIVQARKQLDKNSTNMIPRVTVGSQPVLAVQIVIDDRAVTLQGTSSSTVVSGAGISVSYTLR